LKSRIEGSNPSGSATVLSLYIKYLYESTTRRQPSEMSWEFPIREEMRGPHIIVVLKAKCSARDRTRGLKGGWHGRGPRAAFEYRAVTHASDHGDIGGSSATVNV
jgi:hypothetical protein